MDNLLSYEARGEDFTVNVFFIYIYLGVKIFSIKFNILFKLTIVLVSILV